MNTEVHHHLKHPFLICIAKCTCIGQCMDCKVKCHNLHADLALLSLFFVLQFGWLMNLLTVSSQTPVARPQKPASALLSSNSAVSLWWIVIAVGTCKPFQHSSPDWFPVADPVCPRTCRPSPPLDWSTGYNLFWHRSCLWITTPPLIQTTSQLVKFWFPWIASET